VIKVQPITENLKEDGLHYDITFQIESVSTRADYDEAFQRDDTSLWLGERATNSGHSSVLAAKEHLPLQTGQNNFPSEPSAPTSSCSKKKQQQLLHEQQHLIGRAKLLSNHVASLYQVTSHLLAALDK